MPRVTISPSVFALPAPADGRRVLTDFVETLLEWHSTLSDGTLRLLLSDSTPLILQGAGSYPDHNTLKQVFTSLGVTEYSTGDVLGIINGLLNSAISFEAETGIRYVLYSHTELSVDLNWLGRNPAIRSGVEELMVLTAFCTIYSRIARCSNLFVLPGLSLDQTPVVCQCQIDEVEAIDYRVTVPQNLPMSLQRTIAACSSKNDIWRIIEEVSFWINEPDQRVYAIKIAWLKNALDSEDSTLFEHCPGFVIGRDFKASCSARGFSKEPTKVRKLLRTLVDALNCRASGSPHALRRGPGGGEPPVTRGRDRAMRRDIDYEFHLHYWLLEGGGVEFANIVVHGDFEITR